MTDIVKNFAKGTLSTGYDASATSIVLSAGHGAKFPTPPFNAVWWNATDYPDPSEDPNVEIVRVTNISTDTLTVVRGQEGPSASTKNTASKTYKLIAPLTANTMNEQLAPSVLSLPSLSTFYEWEEWLCGSGSNVGGKLRWNPSADGGSSGWSFQTPVAGHVGLRRLYTNAATNAYCGAMLQNYAGGTPTFSRWDNITNWEHRFIFRLNQVTGVHAFIGINKNVFGSDHGFGMRLDTSLNANWRYVRSVGGGNDYVAATTFAPTAGDWIHLRLRSTEVGVWRISHATNGGAFTSEVTFGPSGCDVTVTLPTADGIDPVYLVNARENVAKQLDIDFWSCKIQNLVR